MKNFYALVLMLSMSFATHGDSASETSNQGEVLMTPTVLIASANRGLGLGLATRYKKEDLHVIATARKPAKAEALNELGVRVE